MDSIQEVVEQFTRHRIEQADRDTDPVLLVMREDRIVSVLESADTGELLGLAGLTAAGYGADALAVVLEGVVPLTGTNPLTGMPWQRGEADAARLAHVGVTQGWVQEVVITVTSRRGGVTRSLVHPVHRSKDTVTVAPGQDQPNGVGPERILQEALDQPQIDPAHIPDPGEQMAAPSGAPLLPVSAGRTLLDVVCTRILDNRLPDGSATFIARELAEMDRLRSEGLMAWQVMVL